MKHPTSPCADCPFSRAIKPGYLGGSDPMNYVGQAEGNFVLPCHKSDGYEQDAGRAHEFAQCAGAAIYRANVGVADRLMEQIHRLPADDTKVFASHAEFIAHHTETSVAWCEVLMRAYPPEFWLARELSHPNVTKVQNAET